MDGTPIAPEDSGAGEPASVEPAEPAVSAQLLAPLLGEHAPPFALIHRAEDGDDRAAVHDMILDPERARHCTGHSTTDDVGRDDLQGTRRRQGNGAFGDAEKSHK